MTPADAALDQNKSDRNPTPFPHFCTANTCWFWAIPRVSITARSRSTKVRWTVGSLVRHVNYLSIDAGNGQIVSVQATRITTRQVAAQDDQADAITVRRPVTRTPLCNTVNCRPFMSPRTVIALPKPARDLSRPMVGYCLPSLALPPTNADWNLERQTVARFYQPPVSVRSSLPGIPPQALSP